jgi:hypothetical protein
MTIWTELRPHRPRGPLARVSLFNAKRDVNGLATLSELPRVRLTPRLAFSAVLDEAGALQASQQPRHLALVDHPRRVGDHAI